MITVSMVTATCMPAGDVSCPDICQIPAATCSIPALAAGEYTVALDNGRSHVLVVGGAGGNATSCMLSRPGGLPPTPLDASKYASGCSADSDCKPVVAGNVCNSCACATAAIAKSADVAYESDYRAAISQCPLDGVEPPCVPCMMPVAACDKSGSGNGRCILK
jgi:hypothetical protein